MNSRICATKDRIMWILIHNMQQKTEYMNTYTQYAKKRILIRYMQRKNRNRWILMRNMQQKNNTYSSYETNAGIDQYLYVLWNNIKID